MCNQCWYEVLPVCGQLVFIMPTVFVRIQMGFCVPTMKVVFMYWCRLLPGAVQTWPRWAHYILIWVILYCVTLKRKDKLFCLKDVITFLKHPKEMLWDVIIKIWAFSFQDGNGVDGTEGKGKVEEREPGFLPDHYAECYPGYHQSLATYISDDEDYSKMDTRGKRLSRYCFDYLLGLIAVHLIASYFPQEFILISSAFQEILTTSAKILQMELGYLSVVPTSVVY